MYAGGLSYFSSGSVRGSLRVGAWAEAVASPDSKSKQIKKRVLDTIKHLKLKKVDRISEHTRGVHQIFQTQTEHLVKKPVCQKFKRGARAASFETPLHRECARRVASLSRACCL